MNKYKKELSENGFTILPQIYSDDEIEQIISAIEKIDTTKQTVRKSADLFAIRQFLKDNTAIKDLIFTKKLKSVIEKIAGNDFFVVKSIYFDKPSRSNWYVPYHQDLTISVEKSRTRRLQKLDSQTKSVFCSASCIHFRKHHHASCSS